MILFSTMCEGIRNIRKLGGDVCAFQKFAVCLPGTNAPVELIFP